MGSLTQRRIVDGLALTLVAAVLACGQAVGGPGSSQAATTASAPRTTSPSAIPSTAGLPTPDPALLTATGCSGTAPTTPPRDLHYYTARIATTWTDTTSNYAHTETLLLELTAPSAYIYAPTTLQFHSDLGPVHTVYGPDATAHSIASQHAAAIAHDLDSPQATAGSARDCTIGGDPASVFGYANGTQLGYRLYVVHKDSLFEILLSGAGGVSDQAIKDSVGMMGSIVWGSWDHPT